MKVKELIEVIIPEQRLGICFLNEKGNFISYNDVLDKEVAKILTQIATYPKGINTTEMILKTNIYVKD